MRPPKILFAVTEDWFFASHFLPMARAAREMDFEVVVVARERRHRAVLEAAGIRLVALEAERRSLSPFAIMQQVTAMQNILQAERPDILHCIALKPMAVAGLAGRLSGIHRRVYALTGLGLIGARKGVVGDFARLGVRLGLSATLEGPQVRYLFENTDDPVTLGLDPANVAKVTVVGGAGVDPLILMPEPMPPPVPLKVAVVARMLWSKGIDVAVTAVTKARISGANVQLSLYGAPDPSNPKAIPEALLREWAKLPGITWHGPTRDVSEVWRNHHICCLPSRGGEGLPRTILEGAACGRPVLTTDVPGCRSFVRDGLDGMVVPVDDHAAMARALVTLSRSPLLVERLGQSARNRVLDGFTERDVMDGVKGLWRDMLGVPQGGILA
ncbi:MAG: glycosyltransferase family 4 protein [Bosea sp. (in: a-proteobacteria)]